MARKAFTVDEATAALPSLQKVFREIDSLRATIHELIKKIEVLELLWGSAARDPSNPDYAEFVRHRDAVDSTLADVQRVVEHGIIARGMRFPAGGIEEGLVDFPTTYRGRWVYLCWRRGETALRYWHEIDGGFQGRQLITAAQRAEMGRDDPASIDDSALDF